jgi:hypothetical protein
MAGSTAIAERFEVQGGMSKGKKGRKRSVIAKTFACQASQPQGLKA